MRVEELRIGSLVETIVADKVVTIAVKGIIPHREFHQIEFDVDDESLRQKIKSYPRCFTYIQGLKPIPLTEEWLKKLGFEEIKYKGLRLFYKDKHEDGLDFWLQCIPEFDTETFVIENDETNSHHRVRCLYVHQLQNLWYAITGQELTPK